MAAPGTADERSEWGRVPRRQPHGVLIEIMQDKALYAQHISPYKRPRANETDINLENPIF